MSSRVRQALSVVLLASGLLAAPGCDSESVTGGAQGLTFEVKPDPAEVGGRFEEVSFILPKIQVLPADPATAALYGVNDLLLLFAPADVNLATGQLEFISNISLAAGTYNVTEFVITPLVLIDDNVVTTPTSPCIDYIPIIDGETPAGIPDEFSFVDPPGFTFTVSPGQTKLSLSIDIPEFINDYEASYTCTLGCGPGGTPCLTGFSQPAYRAAVLANMHFE